MKWKLPPRLLRLWQDEKQRANLLVAVGVAGMALLALSEWLPARPAAEDTAAAPQAQTTDLDAYARQLEQRLRELLCQVEGAGMVEVMVTLAEGERTVYAADTQTSADGAAQRSHVLLAGSGQPALVETVAPPAVQGVAVVCQGGGDAAVQSRITQVVRVLTGVGTNHITVTAMVTPNGGGPL